MTDLLPCPFCGVTGEILSDGKHEWALFAHKDSCLFPNLHKHEIPACDFEAWNTRTFKSVYEDGNLCRIVTDTDTFVPERTCHDDGGTDQNGQQVFNCSDCGCVLSLFDSDGLNTICTSHICDYPRYCPNCGAKVVE